MATKFDVGELSGELAKLRSRPQLHKIAFVLPIAAGEREVARAFLEEGPPFDLETLGFDNHEVLLTDSEVIFIFGSPAGVDALDQILESEDFWDVVGSWERIADGRPRVAEVAYSWRPKND